MENRLFRWERLAARHGSESKHHLILSECSPAGADAQVDSCGSVIIPKRYAGMDEGGLGDGRPGQRVLFRKCFFMRMVEPRGFEPLTPTMPLWCSTN